MLTMWWRPGCSDSCQANLLKQATDSTCFVCRQSNIQAMLSTVSWCSVCSAWWPKSPWGYQLWAANCKTWKRWFGTYPQHESWLWWIWNCSLSDRECCIWWCLLPLQHTKSLQWSVWNQGWGHIVKLWYIAQKWTSRHTHVQKEIIWMGCRRHTCLPASLHPI